MSFVTREQLVTQLELKRVKISVPELGGDAWLREPTALEWDELSRDGTDTTNFRARLVCLCLCDEKGERLLSSGDVDFVGRQPARVIAALYNAAATLCGLRREGDEKN